MSFLFGPILLARDVETAGLAARIAPLLRAGDCLLLEGPIGAGKSTFARALIRARLALRIAELRKRKKLTQGQLAKRLHTTQQVVSDIETFKHPNVTLLTLQKIAHALDSRLVVDLR